MLDSGCGNEVHYFHSSPSLITRLNETAIFHSRPSPRRAHHPMG
jgi:hypothetical protein